MGTAVANRTATAVTHKHSISELVVEINKRIYDSNSAKNRCNKLRLKAGQLLLQLRQRIEAGEEGDIAWWEWFGNLGSNGQAAILLRGRKDAERLMRIASAEDPEQALEDERAKAREGMRRLRANKADVSSKDDTLPDTFQVTSACGTPLYHRKADGTMWSGAPGDDDSKPLPMDDDDEPAGAIQIIEDGKTRRLTKKQTEQFWKANAEGWKATWLPVPSWAHWRRLRPHSRRAG